ncbi:MAG TPA: 4-oxalocrotonate tautomerase family protein [Candidatus Paenalcaligenes intestinipullorum]|uniref:Tautomerase n=1 Tax=Candidatus Paenalcaligenes intestinipullorum TaxID=2838718 RepID=A0A9D2RJV2_9BURK|nr:4-oxalocrotonate tautomerase family protein [Candidatus Paenalcaligenes intestinipullorum]
MPILNIGLIEGRTPEQKEALIKEVTEACVRALDVAPDTVRIILQDIATQDFGVAGESVKTKRERLAK